LTRVAVLGSGGATALLSAVLNEDPDVEMVLRGDDLKAATSGSDLIIGPWVENPVEARSTALAAMSAGVPYLSPSSSPDVVEALLGLTDQARAAGTLVVTGVGWSPGITNLMVKSAAASLENVRKVRIGWVASPAGSLSQSALSRAHGLLTGQATVLQSGKLQSATAGDDAEPVFFPEPVGWRTLRLARAAEPLSLASAYPSLQDLVVKGGLMDPLAEGILRSSAKLPALGPLRSRTLSDKLLAIAGKVKASSQPWSAVRADVTGDRDGREETMTYGVVDQLPNLLVAPLVVAVQILSATSDRPSGAHATEAVFDPDDFFERLAYRGVRLAALQRTS
jgi:saccharopine dehydrogenase-like NADP-dependent oxidoreductase